MPGPCLPAQDAEVLGRYQHNYTLREWRNSLRSGWVRIIHGGRTTAHEVTED